MSNPCRFCGATDRKITREHVWPDWLRDYLPPFDEDADIERWSPGTSRQGWSQPFLTTTVRAFCNGCNSGWMADIEAAAKPIVGPMVIGQPTELDAGAQQIVANWVALKGQVAAQASKLDPRIPEPHYAGVYNVRGAPANTMRMSRARPCRGMSGRVRVQRVKPAPCLTSTDHRATPSFSSGRGMAR